MKINFFPKYSHNGASSRYRVYQYLPFFNDFKTTVNPFFDDNYVPAQSFKSATGALYIVKCYLKRILKMIFIQKKEVVFVQYEFTQFLPFNSVFFKLFKIKYIVDFDDAAFHDYDASSNKIIKFLFKNKIAKVIKNAEFVITGSPYLTEYALKFNTKVTEIPTSIDMLKYPKVHKEKLDNSKMTIGWIGSKTTSVNLLFLIPVFEALIDKGIKFELRFIGFDEKLSPYFSKLPLTIIPWKAESEVSEIRKFDVGIMPLHDTPFNNGKCAFKLIQYMACGVATISTPLAANVKVNRDNENKFAITESDWLQAFLSFWESKSKLKDIGAYNRQIVEKYYCIQTNADKYIGVLKEVSHNKKMHV